MALPSCGTSDAKSHSSYRDAPLPWSYSNQIQLRDIHTGNYASHDLLVQWKVMCLVLTFHDFGVIPSHRRGVFSPFLFHNKRQSQRLHSSVKLDSMYSTLICWRSLRRRAVADINLWLLPGCLAGLSLSVPASQWAQSEKRWTEFSLLITAAQQSVAESLQLACIISHLTEGFLFPSELNVSDTVAQGATLTLGEHYAYWHSPHRREQSDHILDGSSHPHRYSSVANARLYYLRV